MRNPTAQRRRAAELVEAARHVLPESLDLGRIAARRAPERKPDPLPEPARSIAAAVQQHIRSMNGPERPLGFTHGPDVTRGRVWCMFHGPELELEVTIPPQDERSIGFRSRRWSLVVPQPVEHLAEFEMADPTNLDQEAFGRWLTEQTRTALVIARARSAARDEPDAA